MHAYRYVRLPQDGSPSPADSFAAHHVEIICMVAGTAPSTGNACESRHSYTIHNIEFGHRFADALCHSRTDGHADGTLSVNLREFSRTLAEDPACLLKPQCY